jgi:hypothetical protein
VAANVTVAVPLYPVVVQAKPLHAMVVEGGVVSGGRVAWIAWVFVASTLPALSQDRNLIVVLLVTGIGVL